MSTHRKSALHIHEGGGVVVALILRAVVPAGVGAVTMGPKIFSSGTAPSVVLISASLAASTSGVTAVVIVIVVTFVVTVVIVVTVVTSTL